VLCRASRISSFTSTTKHHGAKSWANMRSLMSPNLRTRFMSTRDITTWSHLYSYEELKVVLSCLRNWLGFEPLNAYAESYWAYSHMHCKYDSISAGIPLIWSRAIQFCLEELYPGHQNLIWQSDLPTKFMQFAFKNSSNLRYASVTSYIKAVSTREVHVGVSFAMNSLLTKPVCSLGYFLQDWLCSSK
jgi:hypothetical protein